MIKDLNAAVSNIKLTPEMRRSLFYVLIGVLGCFICFFALPWAVMHAWNDFFHAMFGLPRFYYDNALALIFLVLVVVGIVVLVKD